MTPQVMIEKLIKATSLYSEAGDESNTRRQYLLRANKARAIIMNEVIPALRGLGRNGDGQLLKLTRLLDEHPEGWDGPCECATCMSYAADEYDPADR